jgi:hypothetical protein
MRWFFAVWNDAAIVDNVLQLQKVQPYGKYISLLFVSYESWVIIQVTYDLASFVLDKSVTCSWTWHWPHFCLDMSNVRTCWGLQQMSTKLIELKPGPQNLAPCFGTHFLKVCIIYTDLQSHLNYVLIVSSTVDQRTLYRPLITFKNEYWYTYK